MKIKILVVAFVACVLAPATLGVMRLYTVDAVRARADAGAFVSAAASGGVLGSGVTTIQTTTATVVAMGTGFAAVRGVGLELRDGVVTGVRVCARESDVCAPASVPAGMRLVPQPYAHGVLAWFATHVSRTKIFLWLLLGIPLFILAPLVASEVDADSD